jgi:hypothetical protein
MCQWVCLGVALSAFIALVGESFSGAPLRQGERRIIFLNVYVYLAVSAGSRTREYTHQQQASSILAAPGRF